MLTLPYIKQSISVITSIGICGLLLSQKPAAAQVNVSPLVIITQAKQGTATGFITLVNTGNAVVKMKLYANPFTYSSKGFQVVESSPNDLSPYLIFSPTEVVLEPKQTRRVRLLARLLPSMKLGEYRSVIFAEPVKPPDNLNKKGGLSINTRVGVVVYVRQGETRESLIAKEISYDPETKQLYLSVHNEGNVTIRTQGKWELKQEGKQSLEGQISTTTIIAEGMRNIPLTLSKDQKKETIPSGKYQLTGELSWGDPLNPTQVPFNFPVTIP
ncbi:hypothetical protein [Pseudanabaena sp. ABRG5-3]|uniref:hypothetical protein n=1 Tax=Pseudanabaena sp. ABRG5-3 TaxID=685565 RepID=UPI000DC6F1C6|nr:hypothetical protein [Pseudanabaena sp. ABRG5-3]BBC23739.1 hypothetical protein ABRG53_1482 [Pseudanabaena sp. ABRG5-3]